MTDNLKAREIEILRLMSEGLTNREIGERLYIGVETVRWYAKQIYSKLHVSGRGEAAEKATKLGLLEEKESSDDKPKTKPKHNLPTQLTSFIGREKQIAEISKLLNETRLLTLTGPGGTGKTRLSLKVAGNVVDNFVDGVYFVDLAPISDKEQIPKAIADALGVVENAEEVVIETLKRSIGERKLLLVIDNFEHVIAGASVVFELLTTSNNLKIIATSREALRLSGEQEYPVPSLSITQPNDETQSEAITLFVQRAQRVRPSFRLDDSNIKDIISICKRVDGLPLAIELAAARCKLLTPQALLKRLESRLASLTGGSRDTPQRQQTLQATIDWSYNLLDASEKTLFERLAVFRGGCSLEAIEAICGDDLPIDVFDGLASLVDKSMIRQIENKLGEPHFVMLETIQEYALQRLNENGVTKAMQRRHAQYFMELTERAAPELRLAYQEWWFTKLDIEQNNLRATMAWTLSGEDAEIGLRTVAALRDYWWYQGLHGEGWRWIEHALEFIEDVPDKIRADILLAAGNIAHNRHENVLSERFATDALPIYGALNDERGVAWTFLLLGGIALPIEAGIKMTQEALEVMRDINDIPGQALALNALGLLLLDAKNYKKAEIAFKDCIDISRQTGEIQREFLAMQCLARAAFAQGQITKALKLLTENMALIRKGRSPYALLEVLGFCIVLLVKFERLDSAARILAVVQSREQLTGQRLHPATLRNERLQWKLAESPIYQRAYEADYKMSLEEAVDFALKELRDAANDE